MKRMGGRREEEGPRDNFVEFFTPTLTLTNSAKKTILFLNFLIINKIIPLLMEEHYLDLKGLTFKHY